jgi:hypothetical protein
MSTPASPRFGATEHDTRAVAPRNRVRRLSTETKAAFKTTEFFSYLSPSSSASSSPARWSIRRMPAATAPARSGCTPRSSPSGTWCPAAWRKSGRRDPRDADDSNR